ncbi:hypothetical protein EJ06DRAFT_70387 [Trichodelitschia bisporula]|uniref:Uncharacterized protein n=1 Tax=Trichodelitschia bisporula TaxID=703511 RepID=A0A6G1HTC9_9PEZI|nr:hypothetical protein EJ06DRAFT_70387 [Trichodelitschia bisporula]
MIFAFPTGAVMRQSDFLTPHAPIPLVCAGCGASPHPANGHQHEVVGCSTPSPLAAPKYTDQGAPHALFLPVREGKLGGGGTTSNMVAPLLATVRCFAGSGRPANFMLILVVCGAWDDRALMRGGIELNPLWLKRGDAGSACRSLGMTSGWERGAVTSG